MKTPKSKIYWDTTCWLAWLLDETCWAAPVLQGIRDVVEEVENDKAILFTSVVTRGEIFLGRLSLDQKTKYARLMRRRNVLEINSDPRIMDRVSAIREYHNTRNVKIKTPDATHLATAILYRADEFQTMDGLDKNLKGKRKLLALNGDVGGYNLRIVHPYPRGSAVSPSAITIKGPLFDPRDSN